MDVAFIFPTRELVLWTGLALLSVGALFIVFRVLEGRRGKRLERFVDLKLAPRLLAGLDARLRRPLIWFAVAGFAFMAVAFMQPHWGRDWREVTRRSHDILILLDVSESMLAENPLPNRLDRAKRKIAAIVDKSPGDRFGLIAFSGAAELMVPLTLDHGYFRSVLAAVDTDSIGLEGTDIAAAFDVATAAFRDQVEETGENPKDSRAILLVSDGEAVSGNAGASAKVAAGYARIFVIGVGDPRGTEIVYSDKFGRRARVMDGDKPHISKLDEAALSRFAVQGGRGGYIRSTSNNADVEEIHALIQALFARDISGDIREQLLNRFQWPLALAILCFAAEGCWLVILPWIRRWRERHRAPEDAHYA